MSICCAKNRRLESSSRVNITFTHPTLEYWPLPPKTSPKPYIEAEKVSLVFFFPEHMVRYLCWGFIISRFPQKVCMISLSTCGVNRGLVTLFVASSTTADFQNLFWLHKSTCLVKIWWLSRKYGIPLLVTLFSTKCNPIVVNPVMKMRSHLAAHPH